MIESLIQQYLSWFVGLFAPAEWKAFVLLLAVTIAGTQIIKVCWRFLPIPADRLTYRHSVLYLVACLVSVAVAFAMWPEGFNWWVPGIIGGPASAIVFKLGFALLKKFAPDVAADFNADRRREDRGPPGGFPRRKGDQP